MLEEFLPYKIIEQQLHLYLKVTPSASANRFGKLITEQGYTWLKLYVTTAPEQGKANHAVINFLAAELGLTKSSIHLSKGQTQQHKIFILDTVSNDLLLHLKSL